VEEVVGEILDEYDTPATPMVRKTDDHAYEVLAQMSIFDINEMLSIGIEESEEFDTIGGFLTTAFGKIPVKGEILKTPKALFTIVDADERRVLKVKITLQKN
jgi:CBS domain containing-hemolysin-like protein